MIKNSILFLSIIMIGGCSFLNKSAQKPAPDIYSFSDTITEEGLYADLAVIAHDSLQGREAGTVGEDKAARYLKKRYSELGLQPVADDNSYFQHFELVQPTIEQITYQINDISADTVIDLSTHTKDETASFVTLFGGSDSLSGPVTFAGVGMMDEAQNINQYPENAAGKWLLIFYDQEHTNVRHMQSLLSGEVLGAIILTGADVEDYLDESKTRGSYFSRGRGLSLKYLQDNDTDSKSSAFNRIHPELAVHLLGLDSLGAISVYQQEIIENPTSFKPKDLGITLQHSPQVEENTVISKNVVAFLEGSDPELKDEVVVLSSHYDHVGIGQPDESGDNIYNGADDDGSGTVATLHTAQAMMAAKEAGAGPKRSVLFLHVSAEEKGLLGSRYYSDHPIFPIENTVANLNIDMIGRVDKEHVEDSSYVYIIGGEIISSGLDSLTQVANNMGTPLTLSMRYNDLNDPNQFYRRSDHWNFGRLGVPFVFFFTGTHEDYHRPSDHVDKITFGPYTQRTKLVYNLTALLANSAERPVVDNQEFIEKTQVQPR